MTTPTYKEAKKAKEVLIDYLEMNKDKYGESEFIKDFPYQMQAILALKNILF